MSPPPPRVSRDGASALSYRMLECPDQVAVAQVDNKGLLSSGSVAGTSSLLVTSQETFGVNQTLILAVKVSGRAAGWRQPPTTPALPFSSFLQSLEKRERLFWMFESTGLLLIYRGAFFILMLLFSRWFFFLLAQNNIANVTFTTCFII